MHRPSSVTAANHELVTLAVELVMLLRGHLQLQWAHSVRDLNNARSKKKCTDLRASAEKKKGIDLRASAEKKKCSNLRTSLLITSVTANHELVMELVTLLRGHLQWARCSLIMR